MARGEQRRRPRDRAHGGALPGDLWMRKAALDEGQLTGEKAMTTVDSERLAA